MADARSAPSDETPLTIRGIHFFADGNIILRAKQAPAKRGGRQQKQDVRPQLTCIFRVHMSLLSHHSVVFRNMFSDVSRPEISKGDDTYEGVPVVDMPDNAEEIELLLNSIYALHSILDKAHFEMITSNFMKTDIYLKMASKYEMSLGRTMVANLLKEKWPVKLESFDILEDDMECTSLCPRPDPASAIMLARRHNIPEVLPAAFYILSITNPKKDWKYKSAGTRTYVNGRDRSARWEILGTREHRDLAKGKEELRRETQKLSYYLMHDNEYCDGCKNRQDEIVGGLITEAHDEGILKALRDVEDGDYLGLCEECVDSLREKAQQLRQTIWRDLRSHFNIE